MNDLTLERPDELGVLTTTRSVLLAARQVRLDDDALAAAAERLRRAEVTPPAWNTHYHYTGPPPATALYLLVLDTLNFCFWGEPRWRIIVDGERLDGYWALALALKRAVLAGEPLLEPAWLATITEADLARLLAGEAVIPLLAERVAGLRELGRVLGQRWQGSVERLIAAAGGSAPRLAALVAAEFSSFADVATYAGQPVCLYKRAQIFAGDLFGAFAGQGLGALRDMGQLTAFADYKVPQILRQLGILVYDPALTALVDSRAELPPGSPAEVELRAATVWGVELLRRALAARGLPLAAYQLDWYLWELAQHQSNPRPYHRTRTIFY
jgi:hypothetical protein